MEVEFTPRGFAKLSFEDYNGVECSLQESSAMGTETAVWLGAKKIELKHFKAYEGWKDMPEVDVHTISEHYSANTRMHLTQSQVKELLPHLIKFAETGVLSD